MAFEQLNRETVKKLIYGKQIVHEQQMRKHIPYVRHLTPTIIGLKNGAIAAVIKLDGLFYETKSQAELNTRMEVQNTIIRNFSSSEYSIWSTTIRRQIKPSLERQADGYLANKLDEQYFAKLAEKKLYVNELFLTIIKGNIRGAVGITQLIKNKIEQYTDKESQPKKLKKIVKEFDEKIQTVVQELAAYGARLLTVKETNNGEENQYLSEFCSFINKIIMGAEEQPFPLPRQSIDTFVGTGRLYFGRKVLQIAGATAEDNKFGAILSLKEYPSFTEPGFLDDLLTANNELIITQSFSIVDQPIAQERIARVQRQLEKSDAANSALADDVDYAMNALAKHEAVFGHHHLTILVLASTLEDLDRAIGDVKTHLTHRNIASLREDLNLEPAFWAQLPGNNDYIARGALLSSRNFACLSSLHNFPTGENDGQKIHWHSPVTVFETTSKTAYYFNFHTNDVGHFTVTGPSGSGKTVVMTFLMAQSARITPKPRVVYFDKDRAAEITIRGLGGVYEVINPAEKTGFNPLQMANTAVNRSFLCNLFQILLAPANGGRISQAEKTTIERAVQDIMVLKPSLRKLANFDQLLKGASRANDEDLSSRLKTWVDGENSWCFNAETDVLDLNNVAAIGFDMTSVLNNKTVRIPLLMYLFHRLEQLLNGDPIIFMLDEAWSLLDNPEFSKFINDKIRTIRKLNGIVGLGTQSASDITTNEEVRAILEQCTTNIHFPNPKGNREDYEKHFKLTQKEFEFITRTDPNSHLFLVKHALDSVITRLDLSAMPEYINILSAKPHTLRLCDEVRAENGDNPEAWIPAFLERVRGR